MKHITANFSSPNTFQCAKWSSISLILDSIYRRHIWACTKYAKAGFAVLLNYTFIFTLPGSLISYLFHSQVWFWTEYSLLSYPNGKEKKNQPNKKSLPLFLRLYKKLPLHVLFHEKTVLQMSFTYTAKVLNVKWPLTGPECTRKKRASFFGLPF